MSELWVPVVGYEGLYEVSDLGRVRGLDRVHDNGRGHLRRLRGRVLKTTALPSGHLYIALCREGVARTARVHRVVLEGFVGPCPSGMQGCHWDGDPTNNTVSNLRWDTPKANQQDAIRHGTAGQMRKTHCPQGHEYTPDNTWNYNNSRQCKTCVKARNRAANSRRMAARIAAGEVIRPPKTHCAQGHPYEGDNVGPGMNGSRRCRQCHRDQEARRRARRLNQISA